MCVFYGLFFQHNLCIRYKELAANGSVMNPLITLADNLRMPATLVAKAVLADYLNEEKLNYSSVSSDNSLTDNSFLSTKDNSINNNSEVSKIDTPSSVDNQLSLQLNWLSNKLLSMQTVLPDETLNQSDNSFNTNSSYNTSTITKHLTLTPHNLATCTWLIHTDPQLAYQVYKCSIIDGFYGSCMDFVKR